MIPDYLWKMCFPELYKDRQLHSSYLPTLDDDLILRLKALHGLSSVLCYLFIHPLMLKSAITVNLR